MEIIALYEELGSYRAVAALLGCDHKTVKRCVGLAGELGQLAPARRRARITDDYRELIRERVEQTRGRITSRQLLRLLRAAGYRGSERSLRRAVAEEKRAFREREARRDRCFGPGGPLPASGSFAIGVRRGRWRRRRVRGRLSFVCSVLGYSHHRQLTFSCSERFQALALGLASNLERLGGVPARILFDHPRTVTPSDVAGAAVLNPELVRLAATTASGRRRRPSTTRPRRARRRRWCASPSRT